MPCSGGSRILERVVENFDHTHFLLKFSPFSACWACCAARCSADRDQKDLGRGASKALKRAGTKNDATLPELKCLSKSRNY